MFAESSTNTDTDQVSCVRCHESCAMCQVSDVMHVTCHQRQQPQPRTHPLLTLTLCTAGWFAKTKQRTFRRVSLDHFWPKIEQFWDQCPFYHFYVRNLFEFDFLSLDLCYWDLKYIFDKLTPRGHHTENATYRLNRHRGRFSENKYNSFLMEMEIIPWGWAASRHVTLSAKWLWYFWNTKCIWALHEMKRQVWRTKTAMED